MFFAESEAGLELKVEQFTSKGNKQYDRVEIDKRVIIKQPEEGKYK